MSVSGRRSAAKLPASTTGTLAISMPRVVPAITSQKYWYWADIRQADTSLTGVDFYSQPGRNVRVSFQADF